MITPRYASERGHANHGWLDTFHSFSFADYYDPKFMGFQSLRVINEDKVAAARGFGSHPHRDMEIITYVIAGELEHKDSLGNGSIIRRGEIQRMSAGRGVVHSEFNPSATDPVHLIQIWIEPSRKGLTPSYDQKKFELDSQSNKLTLIASEDGRDGSMKINQDAALFAGNLENGELTYQLQSGRSAWLQVVSGELQIGSLELSAGDGAGINDEEALELKSSGKAEFLLFDLS